MFDRSIFDKLPKHEVTKLRINDGNSNVIFHNLTLKVDIMISDNDEVINGTLKLYDSNFRNVASYELFTSYIENVTYRIITDYNMNEQKYEVHVDITITYKR